MTLVVAHRGDSEKFRENTIPAIESALTQGADIVEIDIRSTHDGIVIVLHDRSLERLWGHPSLASQLTFEQIQNLGFGDFSIPTLAEVIEICSDAKSDLMIDIDDPAIAEAALNVFLASNVKSHKIIWCGNLEAMRIIRNLSATARIWLPWNEKSDVDTNLISELKPEFINSQYSFWNKKRIEFVHSLGLKVSAWTIDDRPTMRWAKSVGIDSVTTNKMEEFQRVMLSLNEVSEVSTALNLDAASEVALALGKWVIQISRWMQPTHILTKSNPADLVTEVDTFVEQHMREVILANFPNHNIVGEEFGGTYSSQQPTWYIDPIDGTTNFANRTPWSSMSLALALDRDPLIGVTIDPWRDVIFHGRKGGGATVNGEVMKLPKGASSHENTPLAGKVVLTELAGSAPWEGLFEFIKLLDQKFCTTRIMGAGTLTLTAVSANYCTAALVHRFSPIDHLAAALIAHESGCVVLNQKGEEELFPLEGGMLIAQPYAAQEVLNLWRAAIA